MIWVIPKTKSGKIYEPVNEDAVRIDDTLYVSTEYAARCCHLTARQFHALYYASHLQDTEEVEGKVYWSIDFLDYLRYPVYI